jgi:hypothetical protein
MQFGADFAIFLLGKQTVSVRFRNEAARKKTRRTNLEAAQDVDVVMHH